MAPWAIIVVAVLAAFVIFLAAPALLIFFAVFYRKKAIPFEQYDLEKFKGHYYIPYLGRIAAARGALQAYDHGEVETISRDGLTLRGDWYDRGSRRTAVLFHGIGAEMYTNLSAQALFLTRCGFNVLLTCNRAHGKSEGRFTTIGLREREDVVSWVQWAEKHGADEILLYGVSMGASMVAYASDRLKNTAVKAMVIDSGFYSVYEQMKRDAHKNHIPGIMVPAQRLLAKLFLRVDLKEATADTLRRAETPAFFLHGTADETVECRWCQINYEACAAPKELLLAEDAPHTLSILRDPETVEKRLKSFFAQYFTNAKEGKS